MCVYFFNFDHLRIKLQSSGFFRGTKFHALLFFSLHSSSTFKLLSMASYGGELLLDSSSTWSGVYIHLFPSPFCCNQTLRSKGIHWWRRSKSYKLHMELHYKKGKPILIFTKKRGLMALVTSPFQGGIASIIHVPHHQPRTSNGVTQVT